jgi:glucose-1-phosphate cytidylyltransferase
MKAVILAGGFGSRLSEETQVKPKPMVEIGGRPILWHIMKIYAAHAITDFIICCGYKGFMIKEYFANYFLHHADWRFDLKNNRMELLRNGVEHWSVTVIDTGENTMTGGRLKRVQEFIGDETFCLTYGDGVSDVDVSKTVEFHRHHKALATLTVIQAPGRFGLVTLGTQQTHVHQFREKPNAQGAWINGGFFVLEPQVFDYIAGDATVWELDPLEKLASDNELVAYKHRGFWLPMDTLRDKMTLEELWASGKAPWKVWDTEGVTEISGRISSPEVAGRMLIPSSESGAICK